MMLLVTGGAASGKSAFAEEAARRLSRGTTAYIATMKAEDGESSARIQKHREMREGKNFFTIEAPDFFPEGEALAPFDAAIFECVSNLLANRMFSRGDAPGQAVRFIVEGIVRMNEKVKNIVVVTNEVFSDGGDYDGATKAYIQALGAVNRALAAAADGVVEVVCSIPVFLKGGDLL